jgi:integrase
MKRHLTELGIERLRPPKQGSLEIFDLGYPGLALRIGHGGAKSFELFYRVDGKLKRQGLGRWPEVSLSRARETWRRTREAISNGERPAGTRDGALLFESVVEEWLKRDQAKNKPRSFYQVTRAVENDLLPAWRGRSVDQITKADVIALLDTIEDRGAPVMASLVARYVRRFFRWCIERDLIEVDPTQGLPRGGNGKSRDRVLSDDELRKVWRATIGLFGLATRLLILTGARREEVTQLRWSEIEGDTIKLEGVRTKNGEPHDIPLSVPARELLAGLPRIGDFVFSIDGERPIRGWSQAKAKLDEACGVSSWRLHDIRRTVATGCQRLSVPLPVTEAILGHTAGSRGGIVGVYQRHTYAEEKQAALEAWGAHVMALVQP